MCRLAAWVGAPLALSEIVVGPDHSLLAQSTEASEAKIAVNGDGFGLAWYGIGEEPGLYRDVQPAWADENLLSLCRNVVSPLFLAHVRASTTGETSRSNCHPFVRGRWSFMHNGQVGSFEQLRRSLEACLPDELYSARRGTTDSELLFLLLLNEGLDDDPALAVERVLRRLYAAAAEKAVRSFFRITCVFSNGEELFCFRHASDHKCPSLYFSSALDSTGTVVASEPLDGVPANWQRVRPDCLMRCGDEIEEIPLDVAAARSPQMVG